MSVGTGSQNEREREREREREKCYWRKLLSLRLYNEGNTNIKQQWTNSAREKPRYSERAGTVPRTLHKPRNDWPGIESVLSRSDGCN